MSNHFSADNLKFPGDDTRLDPTDEYAFRSAENPGTTVLIIDSNPAVRPPVELPPAVITTRDFHPGAVSQINVDHDGDAQADTAFTFILRENLESRRPLDAPSLQPGGPRAEPIGRGHAERRSLRGRGLTMEYLVTMTTRVPDGTPEKAVQDIRAREATRSRELAAQGHLLRLWRPPLQPGEWRTLGLFAAADGDRLEEVLASMPLRVWRTDEVTPLSPHPNDPPPTPGAGQKAAEFLVTFTLAVPPGTPGQTCKTPRPARRRPRATWPARDTCSGCGPWQTGARWACTKPATPPRWRRSWRRCRWLPG